MTFPLRNSLTASDSLPNDRLFSEKHVAAMIGKSEKTLQEERRIYNRCREQNPAEAEKRKEELTPWIVVGTGSVRYRLGDVRAWLDKRRFGGQYGSFETPPPDISDGIGIMTYRLRMGYCQLPCWTANSGFPRHVGRGN